MKEKNESGLKVLEQEEIKAQIGDGLKDFVDISNNVRSNMAISQLRDEYDKILNKLVKTVGKDKNIKLLARMQNLKSVLEFTDKTIDKKDQLLSEINQIEKLLKEKLDILDDQNVQATQSIEEMEGPSEQSNLENLLRELSFIGENEINILKKFEILNEETIAKSNPEDLSRILGLSVNKSIKLSETVKETILKRDRMVLLGKIGEMRKINDKLSKEIEDTTRERGALHGNNRRMQRNYQELAQKYDKNYEEYKVAQGKVADIQVECNRLSFDVSHLKEERTKLLSHIREKQQVLENLQQKFQVIKRNYEFIKGETEFSQDLLKHLDNLLEKSIGEKKDFIDQLSSSEDSLENIYIEIEKIVKKGKKIFYSKYS